MVDKVVPANCQFLRNKIVMLLFICYFESLKFYFINYIFIIINYFIFILRRMQPMTSAHSQAGLLRCIKERMDRNWRTCAATPYVAWREQECRLACRDGSPSMTTAVLCGGVAVRTRLAPCGWWHAGDVSERRLVSLGSGPRWAFFFFFSICLC